MSRAPGRGWHDSGMRRILVPVTGTAVLLLAGCGGDSLPDTVGNNFKSAQKTVRSAGYGHLRSHDALGRQRSQLLDRDWTVCFQSPAPGPVDTGVTVDFGVVKTSERCPATDSGTAAPHAGSTMPDFHGVAVSTARAALPSSTKVTSADVSGRGRAVMVVSNWMVCAQTPAAGTALSGQPVAFQVVKFGETCP